MSPTAKTPAGVADERITRDSIASALRDLQGELDSQTPTLLTKVAYGVGVAAVVAVAVAFLLGRRAGRRRMTFVEVRRV